MIYELNESSINHLIDLFQKKQIDLMKEVNNISDNKESKKMQKQITLMNNLAMNLLKLRDTIKQS